MIWVKHHLWKTHIFACAILSISVEALENGLARTPPMGWSSWNLFEANIDENLFRQMADAMVNTGMRDAGYTYLNLDDAWMATSRDASGRLRADPVRFPSGIAALADYVHSRGLKLGIYGGRGTKTCLGWFPESGSRDSEELDAQTFAAWGVDYLKYDNCFPQSDNVKFANDSELQYRFQLMSNALLNSGREIVFSISTRAFEGTWIVDTGNLWRTSEDIYPKWDVITNIIDQNEALWGYAKPGAWNDPDMLEVGVERNGDALTKNEARAHMSLWSIMTAPLIAGNDLRNMDSAERNILINPEVIAVNQDAAGLQGYRVQDSGDLEVWRKHLGSANGGDKAVVLFNRSANREKITVDWNAIGISGEAEVRDLWARRDRGIFKDSYTTNVPPHGVVMLKITGNSKPSDWTYCAVENHACTFSGTREVRFGANNTFSYGTFSNGVKCSENNFAETTPDARRYCQFKDGLPR